MANLEHLRNYALETRQFKKRLLKAVLLIGILLLILLVRLANLQIFNHRLYTTLAEQNQLEYLPVEPNRGLIYDRNGVLLAENLPIFSLNIITEYVSNIDKTLEELANIIDIKPNDLKRLKKSLKHHRRFEHLLIKNKLTPEEVAAFYVNQYRFPGLVIDTKMSRHYPLANITANALGYVGRVNKQDLKSINSKNYTTEDFIGKTGIEKYYENTLRGKIGHKVVEMDAAGHIVRTVKIIPPIPGDTLHLTIDSKLQKVAIEALGKEHGAVVVIDPNNGEVLALASNPTYNPNLFATGIDSDTFNKLQFSSSKPMYNRATKSHYPFGSTIKPFVAIQALDTKVITPNFKVQDPGWFKLENSKHPPYRDWVHNGHGIVNVARAITVSCNVFFYSIATKLGIERIANILERFGFGNKTNIDITEESQGIVATPKWKMKRTGKRWYPGDTVISSIGQGDMATTPLQLAAAAAAIATKGQRYQVHLLLAQEKSDATKQYQEKKSLPSITLKQPSHWNLIIEAMRTVVMTPYGTAYRRFGQGYNYTVAGKTGGAQLYHHKIVNENPSPESEDTIPKHLRNHNLFIAFAPVESPKVAIAVVTENSVNAPRVARKVLDFCLRNTNTAANPENEV